MATIEVIDPDTGVITREEYDLKVVNLDGQTGIQRETRAMVRREYKRLAEAWKLPVDATMLMTRGSAHLIAKALVDDALRGLVDELKPKQVALELPEDTGRGGQR